MLWVKSIMPLHTRLARILWGGGGGLRARGGELYAGKGSLEGEAIEEGSVTVPEGFEELVCSISKALLGSRKEVYPELTLPQLQSPLVWLVWFGWVIANWRTVARYRSCEPYIGKYFLPLLNCC